MIGWLKSIFSDSAAKVTDSIMDGLDNLFTSDEERLLVKAQIEEAIRQHDLERLKLITDRYNLELQEHTKRWISDNQNGNTLTRSVRPVAFICTVAITLFVFVNLGYGWMAFDPNILQMFLTWVFTPIVGLYTVGRSYEKAKKIVANNDRS